MKLSQYPIITVLPSVSQVPHFIINLSSLRLEEDKKADEGQAKFSAKAMFQTKDRTGQSEVADTVLNTTHQNQIREAFKHSFINFALQCCHLPQKECTG